MSALRHGAFALGITVALGACSAAKSDANGDDASDVGGQTSTAGAAGETLTAGHAAGSGGDATVAGSGGSTAGSAGSAQKAGSGGVHAGGANIGGSASSGSNGGGSSAAGMTGAAGGPVTSCGDIGATDCFSNDDCAASDHCKTIVDEEVICCVPGPRGFGAVGDECSGEDDCASGLCIDSDAFMECTGTCFDGGDCPTDLPTCAPIFGSNNADEYCQPGF